MKKIGIVSGLGAAAGARFYSMLVKECQNRGARYDSDFPEVFLHNIPSLGMDETGICDHGLIQIELSKSIEHLNKSGAEIIMIACNTVHVYHGDLQAQSRAEILNMVEIASMRVTEGSVVGVLSSRSTKDSGLYRDAISRRGAKIIETTEEQQYLIDKSIGSAIAGIILFSDREYLTEIIISMRETGANKIILGCTELPIIVDIRNHALCIDAGQAMIEKALSL